MGTVHDDFSEYVEDKPIEKRQKLHKFDTYSEPAGLASFNNDQVIDKFLNVNSTVRYLDPALRSFDPLNNDIYATQPPVIKPTGMELKKPLSSHTIERQDE